MNGNESTLLPSVILSEGIYTERQTERNKSTTTKTRTEKALINSWKLLLINKKCIHEFGVCAEHSVRFNAFLACVTDWVCVPERERAGEQVCSVWSSVVHWHFAYVIWLEFDSVYCVKLVMFLSACIRWQQMSEWATRSFGFYFVFWIPLCNIIK